MDQLALTVTSAVNAIEEFRLPEIPYNRMVRGLVIGVPVAVLLHETADYWLHPEARENKVNVLHKLPVVGNIINFFVRSWRDQPESKKAHLMTVRNICFMMFLIILYNDEVANGPIEPTQYVENRILSSAAHNTLNNEIYKNRKAIFKAADAVIGEEEMNVVGVEQQRDAVLRRRYLKKH
ncbi:hypothetical protein AGDE_00960 [Angomonas deanei]|uniref:Uncharacterized protein n=1 Tax=Angomonas deanei TaxID=59799 RepID=A0A7G2CCZ7_9TRYP|nr:hypothetical protein AGDE_00960 [Angomonas deanei]CAD2216593.1 hypothetical protein, conserved [Angomonas deanei]|eukprot:EPY42963.1 hypothetical protein AGDE_00960 [Angomonas deanei]